jgi:branched-chain amino acid transport system ATP-binding protein
VSIDVRAGEAIGVVGPNGAGKTSVFGLISGDLSPDSGEVRIEGRRVNRLGPAARCRLGIGRTYQVPRPFAGLTVFENVLVAAQQGGGLRGGRAGKRALAVLEQAGLLASANLRAGALGLLDRKRLELARALGSGPRVLLLDEVAGGLTDPEMEALGQVVQDAVSAGIAVLWIEHVVRALLPVVSRLVCLASGEVIRAGAPVEVLDDALVRSVYLGDLWHLGSPAAASEGGGGDRDQLGEAVAVRRP